MTSGLPLTSAVTVARDGAAEVVVAGSRLRCAAARVQDEDDVRSVVEQVRREHWDARHHCYAAVLASAGRGPAPSTVSSGTVGAAPVLEELRVRGLSDVVAVVTRWPGAEPLGADVLATAYAAAVRAALAEVGTVERVRHLVCEVEVDFTAAGRLEHDLRARGAHVLGVEYPGDALLRFTVPRAAQHVVEEIVEDLTGGTSRPHVVGEQWVDTPR